VSPRDAPDPAYVAVLLPLAGLALLTELMIGR